MSAADSSAPGAHGGAEGRAAGGGPLRIVIADDQASVRQGLELLLGGLPDIEVMATAANGEEALAAVERHKPDAILLDLHMPVLDGIEATRRLTAEHPATAIVVLTTYADDRSVLDALRAGARSYLTKDADRADIAGALHAAARGLAVLDPGVQARLLAATADPAAAPETPDAAAAGAEQQPAIRSDLPDGLTQREAEILGMIARGMTNPEIASSLFLSGHTVKTHINRIFAKTGSRDRMAAAQYAREHHLA
ncbi:MAG TPA: response regulator transcription factor [Micromonosporaceae bacterium]|nr:response regulator transcription factor [Micromonosporaceae bacterium]